MYFQILESYKAKKLRGWVVIFLGVPFHSVPQNTNSQGHILSIRVALLLKNQACNNLILVSPIIYIFVTWTIAFS